MATLGEQSSGAMGKPSSGYHRFKGHFTIRDLTWTRMENVKAGPRGSTLGTSTDPQGP